MSIPRSPSANAIVVPVEGEGVEYRFNGDGAEERHAQWALTGAETYDEVTPIREDPH